MIKLNQNAWLKPYIAFNIDLKTKQQMVCENFFLNQWVINFSEKLWRMWESIERLSFSQ